MNKVLITGGCGFIGHHIVEHFLKNTDWHIYVLDKLTYASYGFERIRDIDAYREDRLTIFTSDISQPIPSGVVSEIKDTNYILHLAAETHVDNSISDPLSFVKANVVGTCHMLEMAKKLDKLKAFVYFSTDEVFGPAPEGVNYSEWDRYNCTNPYSATKAGAEELVLAYLNTYRLPGFITHCMNVFGERQHSEKFIPLCVKKIICGETIEIHSDPTKTKPGSRFYIHARNVANAIHFLLDRFELREKYNIVGEKEVSNVDMAMQIGNMIGKPVKYQLVDFHGSRPGHDLRYSLDGGKMERLGWKIPIIFEQSLRRTIEWMIKPENRRWLNL